MGNKLGEMVIVTKDKVISFFALLVLLQISFINAQDIETKKILIERLILHYLFERNMDVFSALVALLYYHEKMYLI